MSPREDQEAGSAAETAWWFKDGRWYQGADPIDWDKNDAEHAAGFFETYRTSAPDWSESWIAVWHRVGTDMHLLQFGPTCTDAYVKTMPDMMALLKEWSATLANLEGRANGLVNGTSEILKYLADGSVRKELVDLGIAIRDGLAGGGQ